MRLRASLLKYYKIPQSMAAEVEAGGDPEKLEWSRGHLATKGCHGPSWAWAWAWACYMCLLKMLLGTKICVYFYLVVNLCQSLAHSLDFSTWLALSAILRADSFAGSVDC